MSSTAASQAPAKKVPPICIVIPTFNRVDTLANCLRHLEQQTSPDFEVIVVDDGSSDATPQFLKQYAATGHLLLRYASQSNAGPARARNLAISLTQAPLCLFIGDDIFAAPDFVATHLAFHHANPDARFAALGLTVWSESGQTVTPFMRWVENGFQFDYAALLRGTTPDWRHFYTSNLSVKSGLLRRHPFNERFAAHDLLEDGELGYRLQTLEDLYLVFLPGAVAEHLHPTDFRRACRRAFAIGRSYVFFESLWPNALPPKTRSRLLLRKLFGRWTWLLTPSAWLVDKLTRVWCPNPFLRPVLSLHLAAGRSSVDAPARTPASSVL
jgi:glycosyltransferase involved in cell wall biosynthesis